MAANLNTTHAPFPHACTGAARWASRSRTTTLDEFFLESWESGWDYRTARVRVDDKLIDAGVSPGDST